MNQKTQVQCDKVIERVKKKQKSYKNRAYFWQTLHYTLGVLSVSLAALLASKTISGVDNQQIIAAIVAITAGLSTFLRPDAKAKQYNAARSLLRRARNEHAYDNHPLTKALNEADEITTEE
jgi:hypothetical protein